MELQGAMQAVMCWTFPLTLTGAALKWFSNRLKPRSVDSFTQLYKSFVSLFFMGLGVFNYNHQAVESPFTREVLEAHLPRSRKKSRRTHWVLLRWRGRGSAEHVNTICLFMGRECIVLPEHLRAELSHWPWQVQLESGSGGRVPGLLNLLIHSVRASYLSLSSWVPCMARNQ